MASQTHEPQELHATGEHYVPGMDGARIQLEHVHRYRLARDLASGSRVLDLGCGDGYGSALVAETAKVVTAVDVNERLVQRAEEKYGREATNLRFLHGDAEFLPLTSGSFDLCVAFEMIEHVVDPKAALREIRRVLTPSGQLLISTPNGPGNPEAHPRENPFHFHVFDRTALYELLQSEFGSVELYSQSVVVGSAVWNSDPPGEVDVTAHAFPAREPSYLIALAGAAPQAKSLFGPQIYVDVQGRMLDEHAELWRHTQWAASELAQLNRELAEARQRGYRQEDMATELLRAETELANLRALAAALRAAHDEVVQSRAWRVLERIRRRIRGRR